MFGKRLLMYQLVLTKFGKFAKTGCLLQLPIVMDESLQYFEISLLKIDKSNTVLLHQRSGARFAETKQ